MTSSCPYHCCQALVVALLLLSASPSSSTCPILGEEMIISGSCRWENVVQNGCDPSSLGMTKQDFETECDLADVPFRQITNEGYQFDKEFMDGGGRWNEEPLSSKSDTNNKITIADMNRVIRFGESMVVERGKRILWPSYNELEDYYSAQESPSLGKHPYMSNFHLEDSCQLQTVMCCFTESRATTTTIPFQSNAKVCHVDLEDAPASHHINGGYGIYYDAVEEGDGIDSFCSGFTWSRHDPLHPSSMYKGNSLFDLSFHNAATFGYLKNIPGAPMCGCLEQMPTVTKAACRKVNISGERVILTHQQQEGQNNGKLVVKEHSATIEFTDCGDLKEYMLAFHDEQQSNLSWYDKKQIAKHLVGGENDTCEEENERFWNENFWVKREAPLQNVMANSIASVSTSLFEAVDGTKWKQVAGTGIQFLPSRGDMDSRDSLFRNLLAQSSHQIVYRKCETCLESHQHIYYRRLTAVPNDINFLNLFLNDWQGGVGGVGVEPYNYYNNTLHVDFELYSTYEDAIHQTADTRWQFCNYNETNRGFPLACGPTGWVGCQWNAYIDYMCYWSDYNAHSHGFYVEV